MIFTPVSNHIEVALKTTDADTTVILLFMLRQSAPRYVNQLQGTSISSDADCTLDVIVMVDVNAPHKCCQLNILIVDYLVL